MAAKTLGAITERVEKNEVDLFTSGRTVPDAGRYSAETNDFGRIRAGVTTFRFTSTFTVITARA